MESAHSPTYNIWRNRRHCDRFRLPLSQNCTRLRNAFRWKETVGAWEERPGHFDDVWGYWTDDGLGHFEFFQLAEDLGALPVWVFNNGISLIEEVDTSNILPFIQEILDGLEFTRGDANSTWGSVRAEMGHPEPFDLRYVAIGNEECKKKNYREKYRLKTDESWFFYSKLKKHYSNRRCLATGDGEGYWKKWSTTNVTTLPMGLIRP